MRRGLFRLAVVLAVVALCVADAGPEQAEETPGEQAVSAREARARKKEAREIEEKAKAISDPEELAKYNSFVDALLRRLGVFFRSRSDPLTVKISPGDKSGRSGKSKKSGKAGKAGKAGKKSGKASKAGKKSKKSSAKKEKKSKKKGKSNRHPKDLNLEEGAEEEVAEVVEVEQPAEEEVLERQKREVEEEEDDGEYVIEIDEDEFNALFDEDELSRVTRDVDEEMEDEEEEEEEEDDDVSLSRVARDAGDEPAEDDVNRKGKPAKAKKAAKKPKGQPKKAEKKKSGKKDRKGKSSKKSGKKSKKSSKKGKSRSVKATMSGFGTMTRFGDVTVLSKNGGRQVRSSFRTNAVSARVSKDAGKGKDKTEKTAKAITSSLDGSLTIQISKTGRALVSKISIDKPVEVKVDGSLGKGEKSGKFMERLIGRSLPVVEKKLKFAARDILKESSKKV